MSYRTQNAMNASIAGSIGSGMIACWLHQRCRVRDGHLDHRPTATWDDEPPSFLLYLSSTRGPDGCTPDMCGVDGVHLSDNTTDAGLSPPEISRQPASADTVSRLL